ncbi:type III PLP-dependent enzyme domain-containing protein [Sinomicrobium soli]|uniref:Y4yA family PLP-dependent enzyme n=1 Tax=Sinomicrobium sp. N-1-3-6 TaxID=2219864 RepID=UPI000DCEE796|nr:Y4yA family PLP-dependent enzyme [Sinomicrobium sp. N-1-3-6]RAV29244.1 Y4yA family PLP-dependent enzyme [Sinomicrobium sp. N-1-3-6]
MKKPDYLPELTPVVHPWVHELLRQEERMETALSLHGSPVNIHCTVPFRENIGKFRSVFDNLGLEYTLFFARKANKCLVYPEVALGEGEGVDTASYTELRECLEQGADPRKLVVTAAVKNKALVKLAVTHGVPLVIDNEDECRLIQSVCEEAGCTVPVQLRASHFRYEGEVLYSRFGFPVGEIPGWAGRNLGHDGTYHLLKYRGLHFHLSGYSTGQRAEALWQCLEAVRLLKEKGFATESIDMGGGILVNYLEQQTQWRDFFRELEKSVRGDRSPITIHNDGLGLQLYRGEVIGSPQVYPYFNREHGAEFLRTVLDSTNEKGERLCEVLRSQGIRVHLEPGRSLLDQCGITLAKVCFTKKDSAGNTLVGLEMNRTQLRSSSADFLSDPVHISRVSSSGPEAEGYLVGGYCLEQEFILKRKIRFRNLPVTGDWIVFINTAGYMMHFYESRAHRFELAANLLYEEDKLYGI